MKQYHETIKKPIAIEYTEKFLRSVDKNCRTKSLRIKLIDALVKLVHKIPSGGFGAEGVSRATTQAVVMSSISVLVWDYLITAVML